MNRLAIIISAPGGYDKTTDYLQGIEKDVGNWYNFFSSDIGGAWDKTEIEVIPDPTINDINNLQNHLKKNTYDFVILAFSGHGEYNDIERTNMYYINNEIIPESKFLFDVKRQLSIFDACRVYNPNLRKSRSNARHFSNSGQEQYSRKKCKELYNNAILELPSVKGYLYSCSRGEGAIDTDNGGLFTLNLIEAIETISNQKSGIITEYQAFDKAKTYTLEESNNEQNPSYKLQKNARFPIGVSSIANRLIS